MAEGEGGAVAGGRGGEERRVAEDDFVVDRVEVVAADERNSSVSRREGAGEGERRTQSLGRA